MNNIQKFIAFFQKQDPEYILSNNGLTEILLSAGLNNENLDEQPKELNKYFGTGFGLKIWQYPNQFIPYLLFISKYISKIDSYLEIGCRHGGTFIFTNEFIQKFSNKKLYSYACDIIPIQQNLLDYNNENQNSYYIQISSQTEEFKKYISTKHFSLVLIDGDHNYGPVKRDAETVMNHVDIMVFHDISNDNCPGTTLYWKEFKKTYANTFNFYEFTDQYNSVKGNFLGIGCAVKKYYDI